VNTRFEQFFHGNGGQLSSFVDCIRTDPTVARIYSPCGEI